MANELVGADNIPGVEVRFVARGQKNPDEQWDREPGQPPREIPNGPMHHQREHRGGVADPDGLAGRFRLVEMAANFRYSALIACPAGQVSREATDPAAAHASVPNAVPSPGWRRRSATCADAARRVASSVSRSAPVSVRR